MAAVSTQPVASFVEPAAYADRHHALVDACRRGDRAAQHELYRLYSRAMLNTAMRILNHLGEAEDVLQEAFLDAFLKIGEFRQQSTFGAWLKQIVVNRALQQLRQRKMLWADVEEAEGLATAGEAEPEYELSMETVQAGIEQLPDGFRTVLSLYLMEGYDHEEIAQILDITESTSRTPVSYTHLTLPTICSV